ncbi:hypothetical protein PVAP13_1NG522700 [Panicum virgatum]|uniref:Uncharacterized protein n=1 Tax=Panicum virgatum TaxID=38727 RepID=A0A8T0X6F9_PANVG|nr:hypothetical protein PVAP13_1NG522700 [Panicum virgatum]
MRGEQTPAGEAGHVLGRSAGRPAARCMCAWSIAARALLLHHGFSPRRSISVRTPPNKLMGGRASSISSASGGSTADALLIRSCLDTSILSQCIWSGVENKL